MSRISSLRELVELELEDRVGLLVVELEALHQLRRGVGLAVALRIILMVSSSTSKIVSKPSRMWMRRSSSASSNWNRRVTTSSRNFRNSRRISTRFDLIGPAISVFSIGHQAGQVDVERLLERRVLVEVRHHQRRVGAALELEDDAHVVGRFVAHVEQYRQLLVDDHLGDALDQRRLRHAVRDRRDHDAVAALLLALGLSVFHSPRRRTRPARSRRSRAALSSSR